MNAAAPCMYYWQTFGELVFFGHTAPQTLTDSALLDLAQLNQVGLPGPLAVEINRKLGNKFHILRERSQRVPNN